MKKTLLVLIMISVFIGAVMLKPTETTTKTAPTASQTDSVQQQEPEDIFEAAKFGNLDKVKAFLAQGVDINTQSETGTTALMQAANGGHLDIVEFLVKQGANVNLTTKDGWSALLAASNSEVLRYLIKHNADTTVTTDDGFNILMAAAFAGDQTTLAELIKQGADINSKDKFAWSLLINAIKGQHFNVVKYLVDNGADVNANTMHGWTPIMFAAEGESLEIIKYLVKHGADVNTTNPVGWSPLMLAAKFGDLNIIQYLIDQKANIHTKDESLGWNALSVAVYNNHLELVKLLVKKGLDISIVIKDNETLLHIATIKDSLETAKYLIKNGIDIEQKTGWRDSTALHTAAQNGAINILKYLIEEVKAPYDDIKVELLNAAASGGHLAIVEYLYAKGVDVNGYARHAELGFIEYPLMSAARYGHADVVTFLIDKGADVNARDNRGDSALMYAAMIDESDLRIYAKRIKKASPIDNMVSIRALVENGADINAQNNQGETALYQLIKNKSDNVAAFTYLLDKGADVNTIDKDDKTLLYYASRENRTEYGKKYIELLLEKGADITIDSIEATRYRADVFELLLSEMENNGQLDEQVLSELLFSTLNTSTSLLDTVKVLVKKGVNLEALDKYGETPLIQAAFFGHTDIVQYFLAQGVKVNVTNPRGETALMKAVKPFDYHQCSNLDVIQQLVESGADITIKNNTQYTALYLVLSEYCIDTFNYLLDTIIDQNKLNEINKNQLFEYMEKNSDRDYSKFIKSLNQHGITR